MQLFIEESSGDIQRMHTLFYESDGEVPFYNGSNTLALEALVAGAIGWCSAAPNLIDKQPAVLYEMIVRENLHESRQLFYSMLPLLRFIVNKGLASTVKAGLTLRGLNAGVPRYPLKPLVGESLEELRRLMNANTIKVGA